MPKTPDEIAAVIRKHAEYEDVVEISPQQTGTRAIVLSGTDNFGRPRQQYADRLFSMSDDALSKETEQKIWLSAYASNNHLSDYHWHADACWSECERRERPDLYRAAFDRASA